MVADLLVKAKAKLTGIGGYDMDPLYLAEKSGYRGILEDVLKSHGKKPIYLSIEDDEEALLKATENGKKSLKFNKKY